MSINKLKRPKFFLNVIILICICFSCGNREVSNKIETNTMKKEYYINLKIQGIDYELYVNDLLINKSVNNNGIPGPFEINSYLFHQGMQKVQIKLIASKDKLILNENINAIKDKVFITLLEDEDFDNIKIIQTLNFNSIEKGVAVLSNEWYFNVDDAFNIDNLKNSTDLSTLDQDEVLKEVHLKYDELRDLLNKGNSVLFMTELQTPINVTYETEFLDKDERKEYFSNLKEYFSSSKGTIPKIETFNLRLMGNGKAVALEYASGDMEGLGILSSKNTETKILNMNYIILHKPIKTGKFEVFRYQCSFTSY